MLLDGDLQHFVKQNEEWDYDKRPFTKSEDAACIEVFTDSTGRTKANFNVKVSAGQLESWLDLRSCTSANRAASRTDKRALHLLLLPVDEHDECHTPFSNNELRSALNLVKTSSREIRLIRTGPTRYFEVPVRDRGRGFIVRMEGNNERMVSTASMIAINGDRTQTCAVLRVLEYHNIRRITDRIRELKDYVWHPCILAGLQIEVRMSRIGLPLRAHKDNIEDMERIAGVYKNFTKETSQHKTDKFLRPWTSAEFDTIPGNLSSVKTDLLYQKYKCDQFCSLLSFLDIMAEKIGGAEWDLKSCFLKSTIEGYKDRAQYLSDRAETTLQTVRSISFIAFPLL